MLCAPSVGAEFTSAPFRAWFDERFPPIAPPEAWCAGAPLLAAPPLLPLQWGDSEGEQEEDYDS